MRKTRPTKCAITLPDKGIRAMSDLGEIEPGQPPKGAELRGLTGAVSMHRP